MYVTFPPDSRTTRVLDDTILELTATDGDPDDPDDDGEPGHAIERDGPDDDRALQVKRELGEHLIDEWGFAERSSTTGSDSADEPNNTDSTAETDTS